ncbi:maltose acetyltransferase domain-containing protein, partial [Escherichia sp. SP-MK2]
MNMSMTERIKAGKLFTDMCEGLPEKRLRGKTLMYEFNHSHPSEVEKRESLIKEMFATVGENAWIEPPDFRSRRYCQSLSEKSTSHRFFSIHG